MAERLYALKRLGGGSYLLPGNDVDPVEGSGTVFLIEKWEDGPDLGWPKQVTRWRVRMAPWFEFYRSDGMLDDAEWEHVSEELSRAAAIAEAVRISEGRRSKVSP